MANFMTRWASNVARAMRSFDRRRKHLGGFLSQGFFGGSWQGFQKNLDQNVNWRNFDTFGPVQTCSNVIGQDLARLPIRHLREEDDGSFTQLSTQQSAVARVMRRPNSYQTRSDFMMFLTRSLLFNGNAYSPARRNNREEIESLWPQPPTSVQNFIVPSTGEVLYTIAQTDALTLAQLDTLDPRFMVFDENMLHVRMQTPRHPLLGESVLTAALYPATTGNEINKKSASFMGNMNIPSGVLTHPGKILDEPHMKRIKERFKEIVGGDNAGDVAVLTEGMTWQQITMSAVDAELVRIYNLSEKQIFQLFRVPLFLGGELANVRLQDVEEMMRFYVQSCLSFYVTHFELAFERLFNLGPRDSIRFDLDAGLLVGNFEGRMNALAKGVETLLLKPDEGRNRLGLGRVAGGDTLYGQTQLVPIGQNPLAEGEQDANGSNEEPEEEAAAPETAERTVVDFDRKQFLRKASGYER